MRKEELYISTMAEDAGETAREFGLGVEIAEYCTAWNMDRDLFQTKLEVAPKIEGINRLTFHGPFNEISPAAIDPLVLDITKKRYMQALSLAEEYGASKVIVHSGFTSDWYYREWFSDRAIVFWKEFFEEYKGTCQIVWENVLEEDPVHLIAVARAVNNERFKLCIDIGHANASINYGHILGVNKIGEQVDTCPDVYTFVKECAPYISHFHIHNNFGRDTHNDLCDGSIDVRRMFELIDTSCKDVTYTLEVHNAKTNVLWLQNNGILRD